MSSSTPDSVNSRIDGFILGVVVSNSSATTSTEITAAIPSAAPAGGVGAAAGAWDTDTNRNLAITTINDLRTWAIEIDADYERLRIDLDSVKTQLDALLAVLRTNRLIPQ